MENSLVLQNYKIGAYMWHQTNDYLNEIKDNLETKYYDFKISLTLELMYISSYNFNNESNKFIDYCNQETRNETEKSKIRDYVDYQFKKWFNRTKDKAIAKFGVERTKEQINKIINKVLTKYEG